MTENKTILDKEFKKIDVQRQKIIELLSHYTKHRHVKLVQRGNAAIFCALYIARVKNPKPFILIPDMGGWLSYKTYPKMLGFDIKFVKTNRGLIDLIDLEKKAGSGAALIINSFAGYFAEQPLRYISNICRRNDCLLIEDASGSLGDVELCNGEFSDIIIGSFGKWKAVDSGYGGFISVSKKEFFDDSKNIFSVMTFYPDYNLLLEKLKKAGSRVSSLVARAAKAKEDISKKLPNIKIIHKDVRGINVVVRYSDEKEKKEIIDYCESNKFEFVICPNYSRIEETAISIELKRLHVK
jgi:hypothetical protein